MCIPPKLLMGTPPGLSYSCSPSAGSASSYPQTCLCCWYPLIYPSKPVCGAAYELGHVIGLIIMNGRGGHCLILGLLLTWICSVVQLMTQVVQVETTPP